MHENNFDLIQTDDLDDKVDTTLFRKFILFRIFQFYKTLLRTVEK